MSRLGNVPPGGAGDAGTFPQADATLIADGYYTTSATDIAPDLARVYVSALDGTGPRSAALRVVVFNDNGIGDPDPGQVLAVSDELVIDETTALPNWLDVPWSDTRMLPREGGAWVSIWFGTQTGGAAAEVFISSSITPSNQQFDTSVPYDPAADPGSITFVNSTFGWAEPVYLQMVAPPQIGDPTHPDSTFDYSEPDVIVVTGTYTTPAFLTVPASADFWFQGLALGVGGTHQNVRVAIFADSGGTPTTTVLAVSDEVDVVQGNVPRWQHIPWSDTRQLPAATPVWLGFWWGDGDERVKIHRNFGASSRHEHYTTAATYSDTADPSVPSWTDTGDLQSYSIMVALQAAEAVIGEPNISGTSVDNNDPNAIIISGPYTTPPEVTVATSASFRYEGLDLGTGTHQNVRVILFADNAGTPSTTVLAASDERDVGPGDTVPSWVDIPWTDTRELPASTPVWIGYWAGDGDEHVRIHQIEDSGHGNLRYQSAVTYDDTADPTVGSWNDSGGANAYSIVVSLEAPSGGGPGDVATIGATDTADIDTVETTPIEDLSDWLGLTLSGGSSAPAVPPFGYDAVGATGLYDNDTGVFVVAGRFTTGPNNTFLGSGWAYLDSVAGTGARSQKVRLAIFETTSVDGSAVPVPHNTPLGLTDEITVDDGTPAGWVEFPTWDAFGGAPVLAPHSSYMIGIWWGAQTGSGKFRIPVEGNFTGAGDYHVLFQDDSSADYSSTATPTLTGWSGSSDRARLSVYFDANQPVLYGNSDHHNTTITEEYDTDIAIITGWQTTNQAGELASGWLYIDDKAAGTQAMRLLIYAADPSTHDATTTLVGVTDEVTIAAADTGTWVEFPDWTQFGGPPTLAPNTRYWIGAWWGTQSGADKTRVHGHGDAAHNIEGQGSITYSPTANPSVGSWGTGSETRKYSLYFTFA